MKFEQALEQFKIQLEKEYGIDGIVKIALEPDLFTRVMIENSMSPGGKYANFTIEKMGETHILGVQLLSRRRDNF